MLLRALLWSRALYLATGVGENFVTGFGFFIKNLDAPVVHTRPVVLTIDVDGLDLQRDERTYSDAYKTGMIPASRILGVHFLDIEFPEEIAELNRVVKGVSASKIQKVARIHYAMYHEEAA